MTTRELRTFLFQFENQGMTLSELRKLLFEIDDQDAKLSAGDVRKIQRQVSMRTH